MPRTRRLLLGLIGEGIGASRTPSMHEREAAAHGLLCLYQRLELDAAHADALPELLAAAERTGFAGLNVTHPFKQLVMSHLTDIAPDAAAVGAVNTVVLRDGRRIGCNTDWWAFREGLRQSLADAPRRRVVQLGAGGAGAATAYAVLSEGADALHIVDIVPARAQALASRLAHTFPGRVHAPSSADDLVPEADGLIHATPTGMASHPGLPLAAHLLRPALWVAEVVYVPLDTPLLLEARARGCRTVNGAAMALWQAVEAFRLFTGLEADPVRMQQFFDEAAP